MSLIIGKVELAAVEESHINGSENKYGNDGFMYYLYDLTISIKVIKVSGKWLL